MEFPLFDATDEEEKTELTESVATTLANVGPAEEVPMELAPPTNVITNIEQQVSALSPVFAQLPLQIQEFVGMEEGVRNSGLYRNEEIREALVALSLGNLIIAGPPGTGKTSLARALAAAFNVRLMECTANPEWSVYDVIGTQTLRGRDAVPKAGYVTHAVLECYKAIAEEQADESSQQAVWLLIDEINRAEIDRAFGSLFTALSGGVNRLLKLDFLSSGPEIVIPARFRIIATLNSFDTRFVNGMSAALRRRFSRVVVLPPASDSEQRIPEREIDIALQSAAASTALIFGKASAAIDIGWLRSRKDQLQRIFGAFRGFTGNKGLNVGTAHIIDVLTFALALSRLLGTPGTDDLAFARLDEALVARLTSSLESDTSRDALEPQFLSAFSAAFPKLTRTLARVSAFLNASD